MKITIEVGDNYLAAIKRTGSVTRVLTAAADMLENVTTPIEQIEESIQIVDQVKEMEPMLNHIHQQIRDQVIFGQGGKGEPVPA